jgi:hypothetical protein
MATPTNFTPSELEAINYILGAVGQAPVTTLDQLNPDVAIAYDTLLHSNRQVQEEGWTFNREYEYPFTPNNSGHIIIPSNVLELDLSDTQENSGIDSVRRDGRLYNKTQHTFTWPGQVKCDVLWLLKYDDVPKPVQGLIRAKAALDTSQKIIGDETLYNLIKERVEEQRASADGYEVQQGDYGIFGKENYPKFFLSPNLPISFDTLQAASRQIQLEGWAFNREYEVTFTPNGIGEIIVPSNVLQLDLSDTLANSGIYSVIRDGKLYNSTAHTFVWPGPVDCDVLYLIEYAKLPHAIRQLVITTAAKYSIQETGGDSNEEEQQQGGGNSLYSRVMRLVDEARASAIQYESTQGDHGIFGRADYPKFFLSPRVPISFDTLQAASKQIQLEGWTFNREYEYTFTPNVDKEILIPANVLQLDLSTSYYNAGIDSVIRDGKLYNKTDHTFEWKGPVDCDVLWFIEYNKLPAAIQQLVLVTAARYSIKNMDDDNNLYEKVMQMVGEARINAMEYETLQGDYSFFGPSKNMPYYVSYQPYKTLAR